jgi:hypothetical protein
MITRTLLNKNILNLLSKKFFNNNYNKTFRMSLSEQKKSEDIKYLVDNLTKYPDFPKPGIIFR